jgi:uncharacterized membrane protein
MLRTGWVALHLPSPAGHWRRPGLALAIGLSGAVAVAAMWQATIWQNRLRALLEMPELQTIHPLTVAGVSLAVFVALLVLARLVRRTRSGLSRRLSRVLPGPQAALVALVLTALLFWAIGDGVLVHQAMRVFDRFYAELDSRFTEASPRPTDPLKTGGPGSLLSWDGLGRQGRAMIAAGPGAAHIAAMTGKPAIEPIRVYAGLNSAETPQKRVDLVLAEMIRVGGFDRANLVIAVPTGTGWVDPESQSAVEYLLAGDVATVSVQYSYLASWLALLADPDYGTETARALFTTIYEHWRGLPRETRPRLYLFGLSLGALNSDLSHDLFQVISAPYQGALWAGPPFNARTWNTVTRGRNPGSPAWLPSFRDGSVIRFTAQGGQPDEATAPFGPYRVIFLQYASDAITFYDPRSLWRRPDWMTHPRGPDVSADVTWIPVVTFLQLTIDLMTAVKPPIGYGHVYAFDHYLDAWAALTDAPGWTAAELAALKARVAARRAGD